MLGTKQNNGGVMKIGDRVLIDRGYIGCGIGRITGETKTSWRVGSELYTKGSDDFASRRGGSTYAINCIRTLTPEREKEVKLKVVQNRLRNLLNSISVFDLSFEKVDKLLEILESGKDEG